MLINTAQLENHEGQLVSIQGRLVGLEQCFSEEWA